jgi:hypothetical protein
MAISCGTTAGESLCMAEHMTFSLKDATCQPSRRMRRVTLQRQLQIYAKTVSYYENKPQEKPTFQRCETMYVCNKVSRNAMNINCKGGTDPTRGKNSRVTGYSRGFQVTRKALHRSGEKQKTQAHSRSSVQNHPSGSQLVLKQILH